jgi:hypothetical protein
MIQPGCLAEFPSEEALLEAIRDVRAKDYSRLDAFTPYPLDGLQDALGLKRSGLNWLVFPLAMGGAGLGYLIQWYVNAINYPLNVGGRPPRGWPTYIPISFETGVLLGGVGAFVLFFVLSRLPRLWHPVFDVPGFESASRDRFWLGIDRRDPAFEPTHTAALLTSLGASRVELVREKEAP